MAVSEKRKVYLDDRRRAYQHAFDPAAPHGKMVLADLANFCFAHKTTMMPDVRAQCVAEGRRDVWLRIAYHLNLTEEQFWDLYGRTQTE